MYIRTINEFKNVVSKIKESIKEGDCINIFYNSEDYSINVILNNNIYNPLYKISNDLYLKLQNKGLIGENNLDLCSDIYYLHEIIF